MKKRLSIQLLILILLLGLTGSLYATPTQVYLDEVGVSPGSDGWFYFPASINNTVHVLYGEYDLSIDWDMAGPGGFEPISGFCVESAWAPTSAQTYELLDPSDTGEKYKYAAYILSQYESGNITSAQAAQIAVWEVVFDYGNYNLSTGNFYEVSGVDDLHISDANTILNQLPVDLSFFNDDSFRIARNPVGSGAGQDCQDYIIHVPDASIMFLLGPALLSLGLLGRRRRKSKE